MAAAKITPKNLYHAKSGRRTYVKVVACRRESREVMPGGQVDAPSGLPPGKNAEEKHRSYTVESRKPEEGEEPVIKTFHRRELWPRGSIFLGTRTTLELFPAMIGDLVG